MSVFTKIREIGAGSFGKAILVKDGNEKKFVMKSIDMTRLDKKDRENTLNEVQVLSSIKPHPFICRYHQSYIKNGQLRIIVDYCKGGDLRKLIQQQKLTGEHFSEKRLVSWLTQLCLGLKHLHEHHIIHRDLKTQNLFLNERDQVLIGDFGIAKILEGTVAYAQTCIGTPYYLSPELCKNQKYSYPADVWAVGCILYELATLHVPFRGADIISLVDKIVSGEVPKIPKEYSEELRQLCHEILERDVSRRPTIAQIIKREIIQKEIDSMLEANRRSKGTSNGSHKKNKAKKHDAHTQESPQAD